MSSPVLSQIKITGRIHRMAARANEFITYMDSETNKLVGNKDVHVPLSDFTVSQFVIHLLHHSSKPIGENLILRRIRENNVFMPHANIHDVIFEMMVQRLITPVKGKGLILTADMKELIAQTVVQPTVEKE